jgi:hypothetical protein
MVDLNATPSISRTDGLDPAEGVIMDALVLAVNNFVKLPVQHHDDTPDFVQAIHRCQDLLALRIARRHYPDGWTNLTKPTGT